MGSRALTFYDVLGVNRGASQAEIRGAYLRLMKRYHPDSTSLGPTEPDRATLLNRCYATLKDPVSRSLYDAGLERSPPHKPPPHMRNRTAAIPRQRGPRGVGPAFGALALVGALALALWVPTVRSPVQFTATAGWPSDISNDPTGRTAGLRLPSRIRARQIADLARASSFSSAERYSRSCFAQARRAPDPGNFDSCVLFDLAFLFWRPPANETTSPAYFTSQVVSYRHQDALSDLSDRSEARLGRLRERAFTGLIDGLRDKDRGGSNHSTGAGSDRPDRPDFTPRMDKSPSTNVPNWETNQ